MRGFARAARFDMIFMGAVHGISNSGASCHKHRTESSSVVRSCFHMVLVIGYHQTKNLIITYIRAVATLFNLKKETDKYFNPIRLAAMQLPLSVGPLGHKRTMSLFPCQQERQVDTFKQ